jgi:hypothetical protein
MCATRSRDALVKWRREHQELRAAKQRSAGAGFPTIREGGRSRLNHRRSVECERLTKDEAADDRSFDAIRWTSRQAGQIG